MTKTSAPAKAHRPQAYTVFGAASVAGAAVIDQANKTLLGTSDILAVAISIAKGEYKPKSGEPKDADKKRRKPPEGEVPAVAPKQ